MHPLLLEEIITAVEGQPVGKPPPMSISRVGTDSRAVTPGELFFALQGDRFDGHAFVAAALNAGAAAAVVSDLDRCRADPAAAAHLDAGRLIVVHDTTAALGKLAHYYRRLLPATIVAVAGSNGKTTTKAMIHAVLSVSRRGRAAPKSFNNSVGVPLTLLSADLSDEFVVVEIGTNAPGEVAALGAIVEPDIAVLTSLGEEHLEFLGGLDAVAAEEASLLPAVRPGGFAAVHRDFADLAARAGRRLTRIVFGIDPQADLRAGEFCASAEGLRFKVNERFEYRLPVIGRHNAINALGAIAVGRRLAMEHEAIARGLASFSPPPMRLEVVRLGDLILINDAYNANPTSVRAALAALDDFDAPGRRVVVLGDMRELGSHAQRAHAEVGLAAARSSARLIVAVGQFAETLIEAARPIAAAGTTLAAFADHEEARRALPELLAAGDIVLLKGSRGSAMEKLIDALTPIRTKETEAQRAAREASHRSDLPLLARPSSDSPVRAASPAPLRPDR